MLLVGDMADSPAAMTERLRAVFGSEKICLGMRAFHALRMTDLSAANDPFVSEHGDEVPRLLVLDPVKERITVLQGSRMRASLLLKEMARVSKRVWKEDLSRTVKAHLKLLTTRDTTYGRLCVAKQSLQRLEAEEQEAGEEGKEALQDERAELEEEIRTYEAELAQLRVEEKELWQLTRKWSPPDDVTPLDAPDLSALPPGWKEHQTPQGKTYYERPDGSTTWERPAAM